MPTKQITSEQPLVEVALANGDVCHDNLLGGRQQKSNAGHTYDLDCCAVGTQDVLGRLILHGQPMGIHPLLCQQGAGHTRVNYYEALSSLAPGLVTPRDLPGSNTDGDVWLISWLLLSFDWLRLWLGCLEPAHRHTYLLDNQALGTLSRAPGGLATRVFGAADGGVMTGAVIPRKTLSSTFFAMDTASFRAAVGTLCTDSSLYSIACPVPLPIASQSGFPLPSKLVQPGL